MNVGKANIVSHKQEGVGGGFLLACGAKLCSAQLSILGDMKYDDTSGDLFCFALHCHIIA